MPNEKIILVDLYSGSYLDKFIAFEHQNFDCNAIDGMYYGYVPPQDSIEIKRIEKTAKTFVDGVLVVYVQAISEKDKNREIIAYCENARVYAKPQSGEHLNRQFIDKDGTIKTATYSIVSDNLTDLRGASQKFIILRKKYGSSQMFRGQRSYLEKLPQLKKDIISYIREQKIIDEDDITQQANIQKTSPASAEMSARYGNMSDEEIEISGTLQIKKNHAIAKKVLKDSAYKCLVDAEHLTFITSAGVPYAEGHHLIPCTIANSRKYKDVSKLDREENIVCICPNCHRAIHYGDVDTKKRLIEILYKKQRPILTSVGINIPLDELIALY